MNVLVTGAAGYIGSIVVEELLKKDYFVIVIDNLEQGHRGAVSPDAVFYKGDIGRTNDLKKIFTDHRIDAVFHFAAYQRIEYSMNDPALYFRNNVINSIKMLDIICGYGCNKLIFSSSAAVFGEPKYTPVDEKHPQIPINAYGESKLMFEHILDWYHRAYQLKFMSFRYFNAAGASESYGEDHHQESHLIPLVIQVSLGKREYIEIYGNDYPTRDGTCIRDYVHVIDLARAHILGLERIDQYPNGKYNLGNGEGFSVLEIVKSIGRVTGRKIPYRFAPRRVGDVAVLLSSSKKARKELGWNPEFNNIEEIIESAWRWHKNHPNGYRN